MNVGDVFWLITPAAKSQSREPLRPYQAQIVHADTCNGEETGWYTLRRPCEYTHNRFSVEKYCSFTEGLFKTEAEAWVAYKKSMEQYIETKQDEVDKLRLKLAETTARGVMVAHSPD